MSEKIDNAMKVFDELLDELMNDDFDDSQESSEDFKERMKSRLNDVAVDHGFDDFEKMVVINDEHALYQSVVQNLEKIKITCTDEEKELVAKYQKMITTESIDDILVELSKEKDGGTVAAVKQLIVGAKESQLAQLNRDMQKVVESGK